jgi:mRNA-degrading endonuclease RelE of RelBE toxin-antitoxin system
MELFLACEFKKDYQRLPKHLQKRTDEKLFFLLQDIRHPSLRVKKYRKQKGLLELSVTRQYRCLFTIKDRFYYLITVGPHDEVLK